jgi:hypothetical protein
MHIKSPFRMAGSQISEIYPYITAINQTGPSPCQLAHNERNEYVPER